MVEQTAPGATTLPTDVDMVVVGGVFAGLYPLHQRRQRGFANRVLRAADDVGGTWYRNRYPGARFDIPTTDYTFSFNAQIEKDWTCSEEYAAQPEIDVSVVRLRPRPSIQNRDCCVTTCHLPCDHLPTRSWPLFSARDVMHGVIDAFKAENSL